MTYEERCTLKEEAANYSETVVYITQSTGRHISGYCGLYHNQLDRIYSRQEKNRVDIWSGFIWVRTSIW
jgi:hypothetical protein